MIRAGCVLLAVAFACGWLADVYGADLVRFVALAMLVPAAALLLAGREPWPCCCEHCHDHDDGDQGDEVEVGPVEVGKLTATMTVAPVEVTQPRPVIPPRGDDTAPRGLPVIRPGAERNLDPPTGTAPATPPKDTP